MISSTFFHKIIEIGHLLAQGGEIERMLMITLDFAIDTSGAERGFIVLYDKKGEKLTELGRNYRQATITELFKHIDQQFCHQFLRSDHQVISYDYFQKEFLGLQQKFSNQYHIPSLLVFPIIRQMDICGILYLDHSTKKRLFAKKTISTIQSFVDFLSLQIPVIYKRGAQVYPDYSPKEGVRKNGDFDSIIGSHPKLLDVLQVVTQVADTDVPVLIEGETGTGKELIARAIHTHSKRRKLPMISVNCGAFPESLLESEFFGYEKGAFTGAVRDHLGKFEAANGSTIFLDEVDEMSPILQVKLLRIIQWGEFSPLGSNEIKHVNVRIVAASKRDLKSMVDMGQFRDDLYYRLNLIKLELPSLRERREDILQLAYYFLNNLEPDHINSVKTISPEVQKAIQSYNYPGNVRELENIIRRTVLLCKSNTIQLSDLPEEVQKYNASSQGDEIDFLDSFKEAKKKVLEKFEKSYLQIMLEKSNGIISQAARKAAMHEKNFREKLKHYGIHS